MRRASSLATGLAVTATIAVAIGVGARSGGEPSASTTTDVGVPSGARAVDTILAARGRSGRTEGNGESQEAAEGGTVRPSVPVLDEAGRETPLQDADVPAVTQTTSIVRAEITLVDGTTGRGLTRGDVAGESAGWFGVSGGGSTGAFLIAPDGPRYGDIDATPPPFADLREPRATTARRLRWPLYPKVDLDVRIVDRRGAPYRMVSAWRWSVGDRVQEVREVADFGGVVHVRGVPFVPGDRVWLLLTATVAPDAVPAHAASWRGAQGDVRLAAPIDLPTVCPTAADLATLPTIDATIALDRALIPPALSAEPRAAAIDAPERPTATVRVEVRDRDGRALPRARVGVDAGVTWDPSIQGYEPQFGRGVPTDADGRATLSVPADVATRVSLLDLGRTPVTAVVIAREGDDLDVLLEEPEPASLDVEVVDADGRPAPCARLAVRTPSGVPPWDTIDGVVRLDPFTDGDGRRSFARVEPAAVTIEASLGSRHGSAQVRLSPGHRTSVRVVLLAPSATPPAALLAPLR